MLWLYLSLSSGLLLTILTLFERTSSIESKNPRAMSISFNIIAAIFAIIIACIFGDFKKFVLPSNIDFWMIAVLASVFYALYERGRFYVSKILAASVYTTIMTLSTAVAFVGSSILYKEPITPSKLLGFLLITGAILLVSNIKKTKFTMKGIIAAILISTFLGLGWMLDKKGAQMFNPEIYSILIWILPVFFIYFPSVPLSDIKYEIKRASWRIPLMSFLNVSGWFLQLKALTMEEATRVIPILQSYIVLSVIAGIVLLKEKQNIKRKILAGIMAFAGSYIIASKF